MLGMLITPNVNWAPSAWKFWVDHIMKQKPNYGFKRAALYYENGMCASATSKINIKQSEVLALKPYFSELKVQQTISLQGKTYIVKKADESQLVAFSGNKYYIICKSKSMYIVAVSESRTKNEDGAAWLKRLTNKLIEKDY